MESQGKGQVFQGEETVGGKARRWGKVLWRATCQTLCQPLSLFCVFLPFSSPLRWALFSMEGTEAPRS